MSHPPLPPAVTRVLNVGWRDEADPTLVVETIGLALDDLDTVVTRTHAALPLLGGFEEAQAAVTHFEEAVAALRGALDVLAHKADRPSERAEALEAVSARGAAVTETLAVLQRLLGQLPRLYEDPLFNHVAAVALNALKGRLPAHMGATEALRPFLAPLFERSQALEQRVARFAADHPGEGEIRAHAARALSDLRQAVGGFFVFVEEGGGLDDLSNALTLLDRAVGPLAAAIEAMRRVEHDAMAFTSAPALEGVRRALEAMAHGEGDAAAFDEAVQALRGWHLELVRSVRLLDETAWMDEETHAGHIPLLVDCLDRMHAALQEMDVPVDRGGVERVAAALQAFRDSGVELDEIQAALEEHLAQPPDLSGALHFHELFALMRGVYAGTVPDRALREKLDVIANLLAAFRARLESHDAGDEEAETAAAVRALLEVQQHGAECLWRYLEEGDRVDLRRAYGALVPTAVRLASARPPEDDAAGVADCPYCGASGTVSSGRCAECSRMLPSGMRANVGLGLDLLVGAEPGGVNAPQPHP